MKCRARSANSAPGALNLWIRSGMCYEYHCYSNTVCKLGATNSITLPLLHMTGADSTAAYSSILILNDEILKSDIK